MGRGRAKAKATKVARELKYADTGGDLARLQTELATDRPDVAASGPEADQRSDPAGDTD